MMGICEGTFWTMRVVRIIEVEIGYHLRGLCCFIEGATKRALTSWTALIIPHRSCCIFSSLAIERALKLFSTVHDITSSLKPIEQARKQGVWLNFNLGTIGANTLQTVQRWLNSTESGMWANGVLQLIQNHNQREWILVHRLLNLCSAILMTGG